MPMNIEETSRLEGEYELKTCDLKHMSACELNLVKKCSRF